MQSADAIPKIPPEGYAQLSAGLLQADKGVAAAPAQLAPRAGADLPLLKERPKGGHLPEDGTVAESLLPERVAPRRHLRRLSFHGPAHDVR